MKVSVSSSGLSPSTKFLSSESPCLRRCLACLMKTVYPLEMEAVGRAEVQPTEAKGDLFKQGNNP